MDDALRDLRRRLAQDPGDVAPRLVAAAARAGEPAEAVAALGEALTGPLGDAARDDLEAGLAQLAASAGAVVTRFLEAGPPDQAEACMRALVRRGAPARVAAMARRVGALRSLTAARALLPTLDPRLVAAGLPTPPVFLALAEDEAFDDMRAAELPAGIGPERRATGEALVDGHLRLRALHDLLHDAGPVEPGYLEALRAELTAELARGAPRAGWTDWKAMSYALVVELEPHPLGCLPWLEALRHLTPSASWWRWDADQEATRLAAELAAALAGPRAP